MARTLNGTQLLSVAAAVRTGPPFSVACWYRPASISGSQQGLFGIGNDQDVCYALSQLDGGAVGFFPRGAGGASSAISANVGILNGWNHVVLTEASATSHTVRLNGGALASSSVYSGVPAVAAATFVGMNQLSGYFTGTIAEYAVWSVVLDAAEQAALAAAVSPALVRPQALVAHWEIRGALSPEPDRFGRYPLTLDGAPPAASHCRIYLPVSPRVGVYAPPPGPPAPVYIGPANGAANLVPPQPLSWNASAGAASYDVYYGTSATPPLVGTQPDLTYTPPAQAPGTTYYWQIGARNADGVTFGPTWSFTIQALPAAPTYVGPANGAVNLAPPQQLAWNAASGAASYDVYFGTSASPPFVANQTGLTYTPPAQAPGTQYYWRIVAKNAVGETTGATWAFTTLGPPAAPTYVAPADGATGQLAGLALTWAAAAGATGYDVYLGTSPAPPLVASDLTGLTYTPPALANDGQTWYWQIRAKNSSGPTPGAVWSFTMAAPPPAPTYVAPANGATEQLAGLALTWNAAPGATSYDVYFGTAASPPLVASALTALTYTPTIPANDGTVRYWKIVARNAAGTAAGPVWSFTLHQPPAVPHDPTPADAAVEVPAGTVLTWMSERGDTYQVYFGTTDPPPLVVDGSPSASYAPDLAPSTRYYWRIRAVNEAGETLGPLWTFTSAAPPAEPPEAPRSPDPADGATRGPSTLAWVSSGAATYDVYFGTSATPPLVSSAQAANSYALPALTAGQVYFWRIVARNAIGTTSGPTWSFTATVPGAATTPAPASGATDQPNAVTLTWAGPVTPDPLTYTLQYSVNGGPVQTVPGLTRASYALGPLPNAAAVSWAVAPVNNAGATPAPPVWTFTTWVLAAPMLVSPADGAVKVATTAALTWAAAAHADSYDVYFGPAPGPPPLVSSAQTARVYDPPGLLDALTAYTWRIVARNAGGTASSGTATFTTADASGLQIAIDGVTPQMRIAGLAITDQVNDRPNTCTFVVDTTPPTVGQVVEIGLGSLTARDLIFAGTIDEVEALYDLRPTQRAWRVRCVDWWRRFNKQKITRHYDEQSATAIAIDLVTTFAPGFSTAAIAAGLPTISGGIDFIQADLGEALRELATRVGGYWYVDYAQIVHVFLEETTQPPDALVPTRASLLLEPPVTLGRDFSQIRTRVLVQGGSSAAQTDVAAGGTEIPVDDASWYRPTEGFEVLIGPYRMPYTGTFAGGRGSVVRGEDAPTGAAGTPAAALTTGVGGVLGLVNYVVTFKNAIGETVPGPASNSVTGVPVAPPGSAPTPTAVTGLGRLAGTYLYAATLVTARGETTLGPTAPFTAAPFPAPSAPPSVNLASGGGPLVGAYSYVETFITALGETLAGPAGVRTAAAVAVPSAPALNSSGVGPLIGAYSYRVTFVTIFGETTGGAAAARTASAGSWSGSAGLGAAGVGPLVGTYTYRVSYVTAYGETLGSSGSIAPTLVTASAPSVSATGSGYLIDYAVTYTHPEWGESALSPRTTVQTTVFNITCNGLPAGCGWNVYSSGSNASGGPLYKVAERPSTSTTFTHAGQTGPAGDPNPTMGRGVALTSIQAGPTGTVARRIYRTKVGGSSYYLIGEIANGVTSFTDVAPDSSLTAPAPTFNTTGEAFAVSGIFAGPSGVVARRLYRTKAGGSSYFLVGELADNTTTSFTDAVPDDSLTAALPVVATAGGERHTVTVAVGPSDTLARRIYRTKADSPTYSLLAEVPDNTTTSYTDVTPDDGLTGSGPPLVSTAGGRNANVALPVGPAGTTSRRLYRTKVGASGSLYLVGQVNGNAAASLLDEKRDSELGRIAPSDNDAGASVVLVSSIPIGPAAITARRLYRRDAAGVYRFVVELKDNTTTTYTDDKDEDKLGDVAPTVSTIGALPGTTTLLVADPAPFRAAGGWITSGSQIVRYSGISGSMLTGIPASGPGALVAPLKAGDEVIATPMIIGVVISTAIARGEPVAVLERVDDEAAQAALAALEGAGSDGVYEHAIRDSKLDYRMAHATGVADLQLFARPIETLTYASRDPQTASGKTIHADLPELGILGDYTIQQVQIDQIGVAPGVFPRYTVTASSSRFSFEDALRRLALLP